jgi:hypothetical protein
MLLKKKKLFFFPPPYLLARFTTMIYILARVMSQSVHESINLEPFIAVYGNALKRNRYLLAVHFKRRIIIYHSRFNFGPITIPDKSIVIFTRPCPPLGDISNKSILFYHTEDGPHVPNSIPICNKEKHTLLHALVPKNIIVEKYYHENVAYFITTHNPFQSFWIKCKKDNPDKSI